MIVYFKCSFRSSHGFAMSMYDVDCKQLNFLSEKSSASDNLIPKTIYYTLSHQLGRCLILATDENGHYFFGVYSLIEGNDDKYVNAVFYDKGDQNKIIALYNYFCSNQCAATEQLIDSVIRDNSSYNDTNLEYSIDNRIIDSIVSNANNTSNEMKACPPNSLLAFITTDTYSYYQIVLEEKFNVKNMFLSEKFNINDNQIPNYQRATKKYSSLFKSLHSKNDQNKEIKPETLINITTNLSSFTKPMRKAYSDIKILNSSLDKDDKIRSDVIAELHSYCVNAISVYNHLSKICISSAKKHNK